MKSDILKLFTLQRQLFGVCPECNDLFRLSDCKIYLKRKPISDWMDGLDLKSERLERLSEKLDEKEEELRESAREKGRREAQRVIRRKKMRKQKKEQSRPPQSQLPLQPSRPKKQKAGQRSLKISLKSDAELKEIAKDLWSGRIFSDRNIAAHYGKGGFNPRMVGMVFMPLLLMKKTELSLVSLFAVAPSTVYPTVCWKGGAGEDKSEAFSNLINLLK